MHDAAASEHGLLLLGYGVALDWRALRFLVLGDRAATDTALLVAAYLERHHVADLQVFTLGGASRGGTFSFAERFARASPEIARIWAADRAAAEQREQEHWLLVQQQKRRVAELETTLVSLEATISQLRGELKGFRRKSPQWHDCRDEISRVDAQLLSARGKLVQVRRAPPPVVQPLPRDAGLAHTWLFFLHLKRVAPRLRLLSDTAALAQQVLLRPCESPPPRVSWAKSLVQHYNERSRGGDPAGADGHVRLVSAYSPPTSFGPSDVTEMTTKSDGVWYPDSLVPITAFDCGGWALCDPFQQKHESLVSSLTLAYTEKLQPSAAGNGDGKDDDALGGGLQTFMPCYALQETPPDRGNLAIASQGARSGSFPSAVVCGLRTTLAVRSMQQTNAYYRSC